MSTEFRFQIGDFVSWQDPYGRHLQGKVTRRFTPGISSKEPTYHVSIKRQVFVIEESQLTLVGRQGEML